MTIKICPQCGAENPICYWHCGECGYPPTEKIISSLKALPKDSSLKKRLLGGQ